MLALSTRWNAHRHTDGELLLREIQDLGFPAIAVGAGTRPELIAGMKRLFAKGRMLAAAVEGIFPDSPAPQARAGSLPQLAAESSAERKLAVQRFAQTIDYAADLGAPVVLLDFGCTALNGFTRTLAGWARAHRQHSRSYVRLKLAGVQRRSHASRRCLPRMREALETLLPQARERRIKLALVAQPELERIPHESEIESLLQEFHGSGALGYWHDFGAVQTKANLSLLDHRQWLAKMRPHLLGSYVQDALWPDTLNQAPFRGSVDYRALLPRLPIGVPLIWRLPDSMGALEIQQALLAWNEEFSVMAPAS